MSGRRSRRRRSSTGYTVTSDPLADRTRLRFSTVVAIYGSTLVVVALPIVVSTNSNVPVAMFLRDPTTTLRGHPLTGVQSHLGVLVWWAAAAVCLFCATVLRRAQGDRRLRSFLIWSGVITAVLAADDLFVVHEELAPRYLGLDEKAILVAYVTAVGWYLLRFRAIILGSEYTLLLAALLLFGSSIAVDKLVGDRWASPWRIIIEDGLKLLGIVSWSAYLVRASARALTASFAASSSP